jgi:hypothetical protein
MRTAVIDASGTVVNLLKGQIIPEQQSAFVEHFSRQYGPISLCVVEDDRAIWIGGSYTEGEFTPPPEPEPLPEVITETII